MATGIAAAVALPPDIQVLERGWLSSNAVVLLGPHGAAVVDTGYCTHADQTVALVQAALGAQPLAHILNTHLHSDHCGGNAVLQARWPGAHTRIPPGEADAVRAWDDDRLSYRPTGQACPRFRFDGLLEPGTEVRVGARAWQVHAAPGHDTHSVVLYAPDVGVLIAADALWERGFGVVFPEIEGDDAFAAVGATLDVIERLAPRVVIPGHGAVFADVASALAYARKRLAGFVQDPQRHALYAAKVLLKYKLLEWQQVPVASLMAWAQATPYFGRLHHAYFADQAQAAWVQALMDDLVRSGAATRDGGLLINP